MPAIIPLLAPGFQRAGMGDTASERPGGCEVLPEAYIVNGRNAKNGEFPYMVSPAPMVTEQNNLRNSGCKIGCFDTTGCFGLRGFKGEEMGLWRDIN